jgi:hypothetical protein
MAVSRVVSGGQTGVDRAALEAARRAGVPIGGWCPAGGEAEDLPVPPGVRGLFPELRETLSTDPAQRTEWNVRDSDATLVVVREDVVSPGTALTIECTEALDRPHLVVGVRDLVTARDWLEGLPERTVLNVAGPRESEAPGIAAETAVLLGAALGRAD